MTKIFNATILKKSIVLIALLSLAACNFGGKKTNKQENLKELTNLLINKDQMLKAMEMMINQLSQMGRIEQGKSNEILKEMSAKFDSEETRKAFMDIYDKYFNDQEIEDLVKFYKSSVGRKTMEKMPEIMAEASHIGMKVAQEVMMKYMPKEEEKPAEVKPAKSTMKQSVKPAGKMK